MIETRGLRDIAQAALEFQVLHEATPDNTDLRHAAGRRVQTFHRAITPFVALELLNEIESLRCCGNCDHYLAGFCRVDDTMVERKDHCEFWEMVE